MMRARYVRVMIVRVMRGMTWHAGGTARCDACPAGMTATSRRDGAHGT